MTRHEFIGHLRAALAGEIPESVIEENVRFYNRYIDDELAKGRSEDDIFAELGDPRLLAKTITETWQSDDTSLDDDGSGYDQSYGQSYGQGYGSFGAGGSNETYEEDGRRASDYNGGSFININGRRFNMDKWYMKIIPILILILIVCFIFWVIFGLLHLTISILTSPVFWGIVLVLALLGFFSRRR